MVKQTFAILLFLTIVIIGCTDSGHTNLMTYNLTNVEKEIYLEDIVEDPKYVVLETTDESIISYQRKIKVTDSIIAIEVMRNQNRYVLLFNTQGKFLAQVGDLGHSGEEYQYITGWDIDPINKEVVILDHVLDHLIYYGYDGKFKRKTTLHNEIEFISDMVCLPQQRYGIKTEVLPGEGKLLPEFYIVNAEMDSMLLAPKSHWCSEKYRMSHEASILFATNEHLYGNFILNDTLYRLDGNSFSPYGLFYNGDKPKLERNSINDPNVYKRTLTINPVKNGCIINSNFYIPDLNKPDIYTFKSRGMGPLNFSMGCNIQTDCYMYIINAYSLIDHAESLRDTHPDLFKIAKTLNEEDNPVLILKYFKNDI
ncbi:MAG: 6-bladed beta-propeller [Marinifilaceae bacterium]